MPCVTLRSSPHSSMNATPCFRNVGKERLSCATPSSPRPPGTSQPSTGQTSCSCDSPVAPSACANATDTLFNGQCYRACLSAYTASGASCIQNCPAGYTDNGSSCSLVSVVVRLSDARGVVPPTCARAALRACSTTRWAKAAGTLGQGHTERHFPCCLCTTGQADVRPGLRHSGNMQCWRGAVED